MDGGDEWRPEWLDAAESAAAAAVSRNPGGRALDFALRCARPRAWVQTARHVSKQIIDIIYPPSCIACRRATLRAGALCPSCWAKTPFIERPYCERLGTPFAQDLGDGLISPEAFANPPVFGRARAVARYDAGPARDLVHHLKYGDRLELTESMGLWMARAGAGLTADADLIVPVPLHRRKLFQRRFNQAAALAQVVAKHAGKPFDPMALARVKPTIPQVGLTRAQRADNVQGAFRAPDASRPMIKNRNILLVDDVLTTGATLNAAARTLLRAGAKSVDVLVFARVVQES